MKLGKKLFEFEVTQPADLKKHKNSFQETTQHSDYFAEGF